MSTEAVLSHHLQAFAAGDLDETLNDYTERSVLITPDATLKGLDSIRAAFSNFFTGLFKPGRMNSRWIGPKSLERSHTLCGTLSTRGADVKLATDTFVIRDDKIALQTFAARIEEK